MIACIFMPWRQREVTDDPGRLVELLRQAVGRQQQQLRVQEVQEPCGPVDGPDPALRVRVARWDMGMERIRGARMPRQRARMPRQSAWPPCT